MNGLSTGASATTLVPGDPEQVDWLAREYGRYAGGACDAARALRRIDTGEWVGPAGDAFRTAIGEVPAKLERGQSAFARAASALNDYARVLRDAQADAAAAARRYAEGTAATARWQSQEPRPPHDPGADERLAAEHLLAGARERVATAAHRAASVLDDARHGAPHEPGLLSKAVHAVGSFLAGAGEATWGLAEFGFKMSPTYAMIDPEGYVKNLENLGKGVVYGVEHPKEFGKAVVDWDTWAHDPARALGHLVPDLVLAFVTAGSGEAGAAAGRAAEGAEAAEELATRGIRAAAMRAGLSEEETVALEARFENPTEKVLDFQGSGAYRGVDPWSDEILEPGRTFSVATPGEGRFAATPEAVEQVGNDARKYNEGLQIASYKDPVDGSVSYRNGLNTYATREHLPVARGTAVANPRFGAGGLSELFLPAHPEVLEAEGYIELVGTTEMTNVAAGIGPKGLSVLERVPAARGAVAGATGVAASVLTREAACG